MCANGTWRFVIKRGFVLKQNRCSEKFVQSEFTYVRMYCVLWLFDFGVPLVHCCTLPSPRFFWSSEGSRNRSSSGAASRGTGGSNVPWPLGKKSGHRSSFWHDISTLLPQSCPGSGLHWGQVVGVSLLQHVTSRVAETKCTRFYFLQELLTA